MTDKLKELITRSVPGIRLQAEPERSWELETLLSLANLIERLPLGQRQQLAYVTMTRAAQPLLPSGAGLLDQMAQVMIAGRFDIRRRTIFLYDRGVRDGFPELNPALRQQLSQLSAPASANLQALLAPYLLRLGQLPPVKDAQVQMADALSRVQLDLLTRYVQGQPLNPQQAAEWDALNELKVSRRADRASLLAELSQRIQHLQRLPEPLIGQLLREIELSSFGEASLRFLLRDLSDTVRSTPEVSRAEEILLHEMGHLFQLGSLNESHYIREFGKLSDWRERNGEPADGYLGGSFRSAAVADVYRTLASAGAAEPGDYRIGSAPDPGPAPFVSAYARTDPMEDFAESYKAFVFTPLRLLKASPEKFFFLNALPQIQGHATAVAARHQAHYQPQEIEALVTQLLAERGVTDQTALSAFIRTAFEKLLDLAGPGLGMQPDVQLALVETHRPLLDKLGIAYLPGERPH